MNRRDMLKLVGAGMASSGLAAEREPEAVSRDTPVRTYVYKRVGECEIKADVHGGSAGGSARPVIVHLHGGALMMGSRRWMDERITRPLLAKDYIIVSVDYRLAPETKLPEIMRDVRDAFAWVRDQGPRLFGADPERIGVHGGSAGGYLTLMCGHAIEPRPRALVSFFGYGDIIGDWYSKPDAYYVRQPKVIELVARAAIGSREVAEPDPQVRRDQFYVYCRQNGLWPREVTGFDPEREPEKLKPYCPVRNVTKDNPPTLLCHGTKDDDVPYEQSVLMANEFATMGVPFEFIPLHGAGHGFGGADGKALANAYERSVGFLAHYV